MALYYIDTGYGCGGVITNKKNIIVETAPIFKWTKGKHINYVTTYFKKKKQLKQFKKAGE